MKTDYYIENPSEKEHEKNLKGIIEDIKKLNSFYLILVDNDENRCYEYGHKLPLNDLLKVKSICLDVVLNKRYHAKNEP